MTTQSEDIFAILKKNVIKDKSSLYVKGFGKRFTNCAPYDPHFHNRIFRKTHGKGRLIIHVDYNGLQVFYGSKPISELYKEIEPIKLKSIIAFFNCSTGKQETIMKHFSKIENVGGEYERLIEKKLVNIAPLNNSFGKVYDAVIL